MVDETSSLGASIVPEYKFDWDDAPTRTTAELPEQNGDAIEELADIGREDPSCEVTLLGFTEAE